MVLLFPHWFSVWLDKLFCSRCRCCNIGIFLESDAIFFDEEKGGWIKLFVSSQSPWILWQEESKEAFCVAKVKLSRRPKSKLHARKFPFKIEPLYPLVNAIPYPVSRTYVKCTTMIYGYFSPRPLYAHFGTQKRYFSIFNLCLFWGWRWNLKTIFMAWPC